MARARKSHKRREEEVRSTRNELEPAYGQPGQNKYVIYVDYARPDVTTSKVLILNFKARYAAKFFLNLLIENDEWEWVDPIGSRECIKTSLGLKISMFGNDLGPLLKYEPTALEAEWRDERVETNVRRLKYGVSAEDRVHRADDGEDSGEESSGESTGRRKGKKPKKEKKEKKPKLDKTGLVSAIDIAKELGVEGKDVRVILRKMKLQKPEGGWLFDKKTAEDIREKVRKGLKEEAKKKGKKGKKK